MNTTATDEALGELAREVGRRLATEQRQLATAESCTGGWIAKCCTDLAGSSAWFDRGFVSYSDRSKQELLGVDPVTLNTEGAVSRATAVEMAEAARNRAGVNAALAVTGIAGPDGGTASKPVGLVWFAWSLEDRPVSSHVMQFQGGRDAVRRQAVEHALGGLMDMLSPAEDEGTRSG